MIIAGEASGDLHGASLIRELKLIDRSIKIFGIGGDRMIEAGMESQYHIKKMAFLGFIEVLRHLPFIKKVQNEIIEKVKTEKIDTIVLIDYPGFNLDIAKKLKNLNKKIIYYISPQVWAWGKGRIKKIKEIVDKMIVVFPFEEKLYRENNIEAEYVGHPILEHITDYKYLERNELFEKINLDKKKNILLLLPGSRKHEIRKLFPPSIDAAVKLANNFNLQVVVACAENIDTKIFSEVTKETDFKLVKGFTYDLMKHSYFGIIKSGTSTLEAGIFQLPFIVIYSTSTITYLLGRMLVKIKNIAMANILLGGTIVTELIQNQVTSANIYTICKELFSDKSRYENIKTKLGEIRNKLGSTGASKRAAEIIFTQLNET